jgi:hypothetical protein
MKLKNVVAVAVIAIVFVGTLGLGVWQAQREAGRHADVLAQLKESRIQVEAMRSVVGEQATYISVLNSLIGKLKEYNQFDNFTPEQITGLTTVILEQSALHRDVGITPALILAIMEQESGFDPTAVSSANAVGLMQVRRAAAQATLERLGYTYSVQLMQDPLLSAKVGTEYLAWLHRIFMSDGIEGTNDFTYTLTAYNWGPTAAFNLIAGDRGGTLPDLKYAVSVGLLRDNYTAEGME